MSTTTVVDTASPCPLDNPASISVPLGMVGVAGSLQYPVLLVISALALLASFGFVGLRRLRAPSAALAEERPV